MHAQDKSGFGVAHDFTGSLKEESDFPILCETCLGESPYVRMQRDRDGRECHICTRAYTGFRWKPGPKARYKCTVVCQQCARLKNVCQTCLFDLEYGLPVQVRDKIMGESRISLPEHPVNREYLNSRMGDMEQQLPYGKSEEIDEKLKRIARATPYYKRNLPRVCTFWRKGECNRGDECPYLHQELYSDPTLASQNIRDRYVGQDDPVAAKILRLAAGRSEEPPPPEDESITTLFLGGVLDNVSEGDIREKMNVYGEVLAVRMHPQKQMAFVCFVERGSAVAAMKQLGGCLFIRGARMRVAWAKPKAKSPAAEGDSSSSSSTSSSSSSSSSAAVPEGYLPAPIPGLPPVPLPPGVSVPPAVAAGGAIPYRSMMPSEAELAKR